MKPLYTNKKFDGLMDRFEGYLDNMESGSDPADQSKLLDRFESLVVRLEKISASGGPVAKVAAKVVEEVKGSDAAAAGDMDEAFKKACFKNVGGLIEATKKTKLNPDLLLQAVNKYLDLLNC